MLSYHVSLVIILLAVLNYGAMLFDYNLIKLVHSKLNELLKFETYVDKIIIALIIFAGFHIFMKKTLWLPFLGESAFPTLAFVQTVAKKTGDVSIAIKAKPNTRIAYWASLPQKNKDDIPNVTDAYGDYSNSGVVVSDDNGDATLLLDGGTSYRVPTGRVISRHVHYRELDHDYGFLGEVKTISY